MLFEFRTTNANRNLSPNLAARSYSRCVAPKKKPARLESLMGFLVVFISTRIMKDFAEDHPGLMLIKMKGERNGDIGWKGQEFIWPVLVTPLNSRTVIFAHKTQRAVQ